MTDKKRAADASSFTTSAAAPRISEEELQRRIAAFKARVVTRIAGPDHPIYRSGLQMNSIRRVQTTPSQEDDK